MSHNKVIFHSSNKQEQSLREPIKKFNMAALSLIEKKQINVLFYRSDSHTDIFWLPLNKHKTLLN